VADFAEAVTKRIVELTALQGEIQARADREKAAVQTQIDTLIEIDAALKKDAGLEPLYLKALGLNLGLTQRS
jgi:hypothetical protein